MAAEQASCLPKWMFRQLSWGKVAFFRMLSPGKSGFAEKGA
jgi:hypothetical protein